MDRERRRADVRQENLRGELEERTRQGARDQAVRADIEEGARRAAEEERRKLNEDPALVAARRRIDAEV
jgi:hypothetical protein